MSAYTVLDYVQTIASSLDSDEINSINDSVESLQIAKIVKTVYDDLQARADLPEHYTLFELTASGDASKPTQMIKPERVSSIEWVEYDKVQSGSTDPVFQRIDFLPLDQFLKMQDALKVSDSNVGSWDELIDEELDSVTFIYRNDKAPSYYTTYDDRVLIFDSYDAEVDTTLQKTKTRCYGRKDQTFTMDDAFVPYFDRDMSTLLLNEAKVLAFSELKQVGHDVAQKWANRQWTKLNKSKRAVDQNRSELDRLPNYGRC